MTYADVISELCKARYTTITKLEKDLGWSQGTIRRWDKVTPGVDKIVKVAKHLRIPTNMIVDRGNDTDTDESPLVMNFIKEQQNQSPDEGMLIQAYRLIPSEHRMEALEAVFKVKQKYEK